jgi:hypothetical protein
VPCRRLRFVHIPSDVPAVAWGRRGILAACLALGLFGAGCVEPYPIWKKLDNAPFPVTVNALVTGNRNVLSRQHILTYEGWRISFGLDAPTATANTDCTWQARCEVQIHHLRCETETGSQENCSLRLDTLDEACELLIERSRETVGIACPVDIIFDPAQDKLTVMKPSQDNK